jgi:hypothetical protein
MPISIGNVLSRAFQIVTNNRVFWVLGLLLTLFTGTISFSVNRNPFTFASNPATLNEAVGSSALFGCLTALLTILFFILRAAVEGGLIAAVDRTERGAPPTFQQAWRDGQAKMWPILGLNLILVALALVVVIIVVIAAFVVLGAAVASIFTTIDSSLQQPGATPQISPNIGASMGLFVVCLCGLGLLLIPLAVVLGITVQLGERAIVLDNQSVGQAWGTGWRLMRANLGNVIVLLLAQFGVGILVAIVGAVIAIPVGALLLGMNLSSPGAVATLVGIVGGIFLWAVAGLIGALPGAWASSCWTLLYRAATVPVGGGGAALYPGPLPQGPYPGYGPPPGPYGPPPNTGGYTVGGQYPGGYTPGQYPAPPQPPPYTPPPPPMYTPPGSVAPGGAPPPQPLTGVGRWDNMPGGGTPGAPNPYGPPPGPADETGEPENR